MPPFGKKKRKLQPLRINYSARSGAPVQRSRVDYILVVNKLAHLVQEKKKEDKKEGARSTCKKEDDILV